MTDSKPSKVEIDNNDEKLSKALARVASTSSTTTTTSRQWAGFKNPRIVRVSRTFGGKDRHSKVCTIRGLRDRRIRLSVPTAIQLYDLQDRLGLSQPSKVIDWLLEATKLDIDKLPPLQIPPGSFVDFHQQSLFGHLANPTPYLDPTSKEGININADLDEDDEDGHNEEPKNNNNNVQVSAQSFFPMGGSSINNGYFPGLPYGNMYHWDPSSLSLAQFGSHSQADHQDPHHINNNNNSNYNGVGVGVGSSTHQLFFCPPLATTSLFPQHENRFQLGSNNSNNSMSSHFVSHHDASQQDKDHHQHGN